MAHLLHKYHSSALFLGIGMLMLFSFCAPAFASDAPVNPTFRSTSPFGINQTIKEPATVNINGIHQGTIYKPFSSDHPYADLNPGSGSGGSGDPNDDIGIPGWADTPSEPLPIGDGMGILLLMATMMVGAIFLKQRKQLSESISKSTTSTTNINNLRGNQLPTALKKENNPTQHMTTRKQTYQSLRQKLFLLLAFVCVAGQVSAQTAIYFRPSTITIDDGDGTTTNWCKQNSNTWFAMLRSTTGQTGTKYAIWHVNTYTTEYTTADIYAGNDHSRFLGYTIKNDATWRFAFYRIDPGGKYTDYQEAADGTGKTLANTGTGKLMDCVPGNKWWHDGNNNEWYTNMFTVGSLGAGHNLVGICEGQWGGTGIGADQGYYCAYYVDQDAHLYFANIHNWGEPMFLRGKDVYTYKDAATKITGTRLYYTKLAKKSGIAYKEYAYIDNTTGNWADYDTKWKELWKKYPTGTTGPKITALNENKISNRLNQYTMHTTLKDGDKLAGTTRLFIPRAQTNTYYQENSTLTSYTALNCTLTVQTYSAQKANVNSALTYANNTNGGTITYSAYYLSEQGTSKKVTGSSTTASTAITAAYTGEIELTAVPKPGYKFVGWYSTDGNLLSSNSTWETEKERGNTTIHARFLAIKKTVRMQTFGWYQDPEDKNYKYMWREIADGGQKITITYNDGTGQKTIEKFDAPETSILSPERNTIQLKAEPKTGYTFIGWWNNGSNYQDNPWKFLPEETNQSITARFAKCYSQTIGKTCYDPATKTYTETNEGGNIQISYDDGFQQPIAAVSPSNTYRTIEQSTVTLKRNSTHDGYVFLGWYEEGSSEPLTTNDEYTYKATSSQNISARFVQIIKQTIATNPANGNGGTFDASYIHNNVEYINNNKVSYGPFDIQTNEDITVTANPKTGYTFVGWYYNGEFKSSDLTYTYQPSIDGATMTAYFVLANAEHAIALLTYDPTYNEYKPVNPGGSVTYTTKKANGLNLDPVNGTTETATTFTAASGQNVTLSATAKTDYDFIGFYEGDILLAEGGGEAKAYTYEYTATSEGSHITARFAPKNSLKITLVPNSAGTYIAKYGYNQTTLYAKESSLTDEVITYAPMNMIYGVSSVKPILGYKFVKMYPNGNINYNYSLGQYSGPQGADRKIVVNFVRSEAQDVYLALNGQWSDNNHKYYVYATNIARRSSNVDQTFEWIAMEAVSQGSLYKCTVPADLYSHIAFVQFASNAAIPKKALSAQTSPKPTAQTKLFTIPATRMNCMTLMSAYNSSIGGYEDMWSEPPTQVGDFRLVYIEQTVESKDNITVDYLFDDAGLIKKKADSQDIISLHIYNKVSDGINGVNNPEVILQRCTGFVDGKSQWEDVERYMVFGPLRSDKPGVIRMPGRRNAGATINYDNGIDIIKNYGDDQHKGSGVWNFVIQQTIDNKGNVTAKLLVDKTHRYNGDYYIRTTNAPGQYYQYTHPGNIMTYSKYAAANSDYTDYFIRYVDINEDGTPTAEAGKHPLVKFAIANDHSVYLNHEFMMENNYGTDLFVKNTDGAPNLPADASVRFGWDRVTNHLTRAYIANTTTKNNEYLVIEGENIGDATYFTDNSNWLYTIDLNATKDADNDAAAKVKAKMNGQYQYFMGSEQSNETLISGNGAGTYPIRLLYDFKDDRFTTIYHPQGTISGTTDLQTPVMIEREHNYAPTQIQFTNAQTTIKATDTDEDQYTHPAYAVMTFLGNILTDPAITHHEKMFYWVSFPFDVKISEVFGLGKYGQYWIMQRYDGAQRAASGLAQTNWKYITNTGYTLEKNIGYVICLNYSQLVTDGIATKDNKISLYFPSNSVVSPANITGGQTRTVELARYENANTAWNHHNWHIIGVPSFANPDFSTTQGDVPFFYQYWHPTDGYAAVASTEVDFYAMHSYMVQYTGDIKWTSVVNTGDGSVTPSKLAAKTDEQADKNIMLRLELQQAGSTLDKTYVQLRNDKGTKGFDMSLDLTKIINAGANIYSIVDNHEMAGNAIPKDETVLPLGVVITAAGEYTIAMPNGTEGMIVELIDYEQGTSTNLLMSDYTVNMPEGTNNTRFALRLKPDKVATSVEDITSGTNDNNVRKLLIDGVLYLQKGNNTYDAQGHAIR